MTTVSNKRDWQAIVRRRIRAAEDRSTSNLRTIRRALTRALTDVTGTDVLDIVEGIVLSDPAFPQWVAYEIVHYHNEAMARVSAARLNRIAKALNGWGDVDPFACYVVGPAWREGRVSINLLRQWTRSKNRWKRRSALVSTVPLNCTARGGTGDADRSLAICGLMIDDRDDTIVKAMSWALRELAVKEPSRVRKFVADNRQKLAARVVREVTNKLESGLKNRKSTRQTTPKHKGARGR